MANYLLVFDDKYDHCATEYDTLTEVAESIKNISYLDRYSLYKISEEIDVIKLVESYNTQQEQKRQEALAKLTEDEKELLGLIKA